MSTAYAPTCLHCGAANQGTKFCENCGQPAVAVASLPTPSPSVAAAPPAVPSTAVRAEPRVIVIRVLTALTFLAADFLPNVIAQISGDYSTGFLVPMWIFLIISVAVGVIMVIASTSSPNRLVGGIVLVLAYGIMAAIVGSNPFDYFNIGFTILQFLSATALFLAWAVSAGLRGAGYLGAFIGLIFFTVYSMIERALPFNSNFFVIYFVDFVLFGAVVAGTLALSRIFSKAAGAPAPVSESQVGAPQANLYVTPSTPNPAPTQAAVPAPAPPAPAPAAPFPAPAPPVPTPQYGYVAQVPGSPQMYLPPTNTLAVLSLVFGLMGGLVLPIVFGHIAKAQIRRTGERGDGLATAGLFFGYLWLIIGVILLFVWIGIIVSAVNRY
jgi:hypothetical protein